MTETFAEHLKSRPWWSPDQRIILGYSGGADSGLLLDLCAELGLDVVAAHLHHGQRPEAEEEAKLAEAFASERNVPFLLGRAEVPRLARDLGIGLEEAGRRARYDFFRQAAYQMNAHLVFTAHTATDHAETVVFHLVNGAGLAGLAGIPEFRGNIARPLLPFTRAEVRAEADRRGLWYHDDPGNEDPQFSRARLRRDVFPILRELQPELETTISRTAQLCREEDEYLDGIAAAALEQTEVPLNGELRWLSEGFEAAFRRRDLMMVPAVVFRRAIRLMARFGGADPSFRQVQTVVEAVEELSGSVTFEAGQVRLSWDEERYHVQPHQPVSPYRFALTIPGDVDSEEFGWTFRVRPGTFLPQEARQTDRITVPARLARGGLYFRSAEPGDRIRPLGFDGTRKLSDILSESNLTQTARARLPILCDLTGPLWVPFVTLDARINDAEPQSPGWQVQFGPTAQLGAS